MKKHSLPSREVHLDFHTSPAIPGIGELFDKKEWQETLKKGHVNSITVFSKCHHGLSYHPTKIGKMHPHLKFDLLRAQIDACKEIGVKTPVYLSAGLDTVAAEEHPEWREYDFGWKYDVWVGFRKLCFNSKYIDYLCEQIKEATKLFPEANGIFLDIISQGQCVCQSCLDVMKREGLNPLVEADRVACSQLALKRYYEMTTAAAKFYNKDMPVFHNSGHISAGRRDVVAFDSHLELESLPTGGWGYDHFPMSAAYCRTLGYDFLGMTGKFHTTWGEFGGLKHPNALKFECGAMIAQGAKCSVGDQLHPSGKLDISTYELIGEAYKDVEAKEPWWLDAKSVSDIGLLSANATHGGKRGDDNSDTGAGRLLLEGHYLFDILDQHSDLKGYKVMAVPEDAVLDASLVKKIKAHLAAGGKLVISGKAAFDEKGNALFDIGVKSAVPSEFEPDYVLPSEEARPDFVKTPFVMYMRGMRVKAGKGAKSLGKVYDPYFNRTLEHFCSHQHTPPKTEPSGYDAGILKGNILYFAHPVFTIYRGYGAVAMREFVHRAFKMLLGSGETSVETNMPSSARTTLAKQAKEKRYVLHAFYANTSQRGGKLNLSGGTTSNSTRGVEVIDEIIPLHDLEFSVNVKEKIKKVSIVPEGEEIAFEREGGSVKFKLDKLACHCMIELQY